MNEVPRQLNSARPLDLGAEGDFRLGVLNVAPATRIVSAGERQKIIEPRVMQVLVALARAEGVVVSRDQLIERCWGGRIVSDDAVNSCLAKVRALRDFAQGPSFEIETIPRVGYRLAVERTPSQAVTVAWGKAQPAGLPEPSRNRVWAVAALLIMLGSLAALFLLHRLGNGAPVPALQAETPTSAKPSIAVLPFRNLSTSAQTAYFAEGIQDEILTRLAKIGSLKVISRTSTEPYAGRIQNLRQIARELGVENVLEGDVQRDGNRVRINVQLIRASGDSHLWAEDYDRTLTDIFSVESEVARTIAATLAAHLTGSELRLVNAKPTSNPKAHDSYLRGVVWLGKPLQPGSTSRAAAAFEDAVRLDPRFAPAWALLSRVYASMAMDGIAGRHEQARAALARARALDPQSPDTQVAAAFFKYYGEQDFRGAIRDFQALRRKWPNNVDVLRALGLLSRRIGQAPNAVSYFREALAVDPHNLVHRIALADILNGLHRFPEALRVLDDALTIWPGNVEILSWKAGDLQQSGDIHAAGAILARIPENKGLQAIDFLATQYLYERRYADGARYIQALLADQGPKPAPEITAPLLTYAGDLEARAGWLELARRNLTEARDLWMDEAKAAPRNTSVLEPLAYVYASLKDKRAAVAIANRCIADYPLARDAIEGVKCAMARSVVAARFGDRPIALALLTKVSDYAWSPSPASLRLDPDWDSLRGDPEFEKLAHADGQ
jgi:TolB-like protein/DNA-binding winged helix-turn-helix (wHTH) protein/Tfp pilus assembly protein PilF